MVTKAYIALGAWGTEVSCMGTGMDAGSRTLGCSLLLRSTVAVLKGTGGGERRRSGDGGSRRRREGLVVGGKSSETLSRHICRRWTPNA